MNNNYNSHDSLTADVAKYRLMVFRLAFSLLGNRFDADDMAQEAFLRLYNYSKPFGDDEHKKAFLIRVTINLCKNLQKSAMRKKRTELDENTPHTAQYAYNEDESLLRDYILQLKPNYRAVIYLFYYEGYSAAETARLLKISETAVTTRLQRARAMLKENLTNSTNPTNDMEVFT